MLSSSTYSLKFSFVFCSLLCFLHLMALVVLFFSLAKSVLLWLAMMAVLASFIWQFRACNTLVMLKITSTQIQLFGKNSKVSDGEVLSSTVVIPYAVFLHIQTLNSRQKKYYLIMFDAMSAQDFRHFRIALKLPQVSAAEASK